MVLNESQLNTSIANIAEIAEDADKKIDVDQLLNSDELTFEKLQKPVATISFTSSRWFVRFSVKNPGTSAEILLETARPITNRVDLFEVEKGEIVNSWKNGDAREFDEKAFEHRKSIFPIDFEAGEEKSFYLVLESDGEAINLPLIFWEANHFYMNDYKVQLYHGIYFGMLALVIFIFFIFYLLLKEVSFLLYVLYVFFQLLLQLSLEGFSFQFLFPTQLFWTNNVVVLSSGGTVFFAILYAVHFLKLKERLPKWHLFYRIILVLILLIAGMSLTNTTILHNLSYPIINGVSFVGIVSIVYLIFNLKAAGYKVNNAFALGFTVLILGAVVFILGNTGILGNAQVSELSLKLSSGLEVLALSASMAGKYRELQQEKELAQEKALEQLEQLVQVRTAEVYSQKEKIEEQNKDIVDSIRYAQRIQGAMLPDEQSLKEVLADHFIFFRPRDIVSGDFYYVDKVKDGQGQIHDVFAAVDCTGHGVPGAFMSFIGYNLLKDFFKQNPVGNLEKSLETINQGLLELLNTHMDENRSQNLRDGMDMALCSLDRSANRLYFSGAKNPLYIVANNDSKREFPHSKEPITSADGSKMLVEIKADRHPIGLYGELSNHVFESHLIHVQSGDIIYIFSDGYADQFGGYDDALKVKRMGAKRFKNLILEIADQDLNKQKKTLAKSFDNWRGPHEQLDDVVVMAIKV